MIQQFVARFQAGIAIALCVTPHACAPRVQLGTVGYPTIDVPTHARDAIALIADQPNDPSDGHEQSSSPLLRTVNEVTQRMVQLRGLRQREPMITGVLSREEILQRLRTRVAEEYHDDELAREGALNRAIGLWADPRDYVTTTFELLEEQVAGFYDPTRRQLIVASWLSAEEQVPTLAHELTHALQDQHFQIGRFVHHERLRGDAQIAAMAVVEGDATLAMLATVTPNDRLDVAARVLMNAMDRRPQTRRMAEAPLVLRETMLFPYRYGLELCVSAYSSGGWGAINSLLATPPTSSEQVFHPEKLAQREAPMEVTVDIAPALAATHELAYEETMGELGVRLWLRTWIDHGLADEAAEGWGGDHAMLLTLRNASPQQRLQHTIGLWKIVADPSPRDVEAHQLERGAVEAIRRRYTRMPLTSVRGATVAITMGTNDNIAFVARRRNTVVVGIGVPRAVAAQTLSAALR